MPTHKKFFIYFLLVVAFFIFSQIIIHITINITYDYKSVQVKGTIPMSAEVQATSVNGFAKIKVKNITDSSIENKYIKINCYSKNDVLMGTKYIKIGKIEAKEEKEFEVRFNFNRVERAVIETVEEQALTDEPVQKEQLMSDPKMGLIALVAAFTVLYFI